MINELITEMNEIGIEPVESDAVLPSVGDADKKEEI